MTQEQHGHNARATRGDARSKRRSRPDPSGEHERTQSPGLAGALVRWLRKQATRASRWLRRRLRFSRAAILDLFRRWTKGGGFGTWWLVVTLLLAGAVGLVVAALLTPVMGLLAGLAVAIWWLFRKRTDNTRRKSGEHHARKRRTDRDEVGSSAAV